MTLSSFLAIQLFLPFTRPDPCSTPALLYSSTLVTTPAPDGAAALADGEAQPLFQGDRLDQPDLHVDVVAGHHHLHALGQLAASGDVGRAQVELRPVAGEERRVPAALFLRQDVDPARRSRCAA